MSNAKLSCYDICCGAGIFALGFKRAGFHIIGGIDKEIYAIETAKHNMPEGLWIQTSIEELSKIIAKGNDHSIRKANVIIAGLPCQGFSMAGNNKPDDDRNILYKYLLKAIGKIMPDFVVIENVRGLLTKKNEKVFSDILKTFKRLGYDVGYRVYNAVNFGIPQRRKRVFIIASLRIPIRFVFAGVRFSNESKTVKDAFKGLNPKKEDPAINHTFMVHSNKVINKIRNIKKGGPISYRRLMKQEPSVTIISGHNALPVHPKEHRAISNREAARIQGIPDDFILKGSRTDQTMLVANAVPLPLGLQIAKAIKNAQKLQISHQGKLLKILFSKTDDSIKKMFKKGFVNYYREQGRKYSWRSIADPYKILLTEILLQRTKADMVREVWKGIIDSIKPSKNGFQLNVSRLNKSIKKIGIFTRVETIKQLNSALVRYFRKKVPENFDELMNLPGVGIYIAAAVRTFAFNIPDFPVDSNSFRFIGRFYGMKIWGRKSESRQIREFMNTIIDPKTPKEYVYGFLDFCAKVCTPKNPRCDQCFLGTICKYKN